MKPIYICESERFFGLADLMVYLRSKMISIKEIVPVRENVYLVVVRPCAYKIKSFI